jgi:hypothetical protein
MLKVTRAGLVVALAALAAVPARAVETTPANVVGALFETPHLDNLAQGAHVVYRLQRTVSDAQLLGQPWSDDIKLDIRKVEGDGKREVVMQIFSGERAREPQDITDMTGNPLLVLFLDRCVKNFNQVAGGNPPYLKNAFRTALREKAKIEPVKFDFDGHTVDGYRVFVQPYIDDANAPKMQGYEGSRFSIVVSDAVPGRFAELVSNIENKDEKIPKLEERITVAGFGGVK